MTTTVRERKLAGQAYGRASQSHDAEIAEVGPGTPCGEFMRRYWHPISVSEKVTTRPQNVRILGEDLILFRDRRGRPGLLYPRCMHRGTTLFYGRVEDEGIRCCYHGWLFAVDGTCLDQPCEPEHGLHRDIARQPWYPVQEHYGLVWAYMGPPEKRPLLPLYDVFEDLNSGEKIWADDSSLGGGGDQTESIIPCNWLQDWENVMDPFHVPILHTTFSGTQFVPEFGIMPSVEWEYQPSGMQYTAYRRLDDGRHVDRVTHVLFPHARIVPSVEMKSGPPTRVGWVVPVDDTHYRLFHAFRATEDYVPEEIRPFNGKAWSELSEEEHQSIPGDWEAQVGQGPISLHSEENLATSDRGIVMLRRLLREQVRIVAEGGDPLGINFDTERQVIKVAAGNFYREV